MIFSVFLLGNTMVTPHCIEHHFDRRSAAESDKLFAP